MSFAGSCMMAAITANFEIWSVDEGTGNRCSRFIGMHCIERLLARGTVASTI